MAELFVHMVTYARAEADLAVWRNVGKYQNGTSYTRVSARHL